MGDGTSKNSEITCTKVAMFTISAVMIQIVGLSLFIMGFFPVKPTLSGFSGPESFYPPGPDSADLAQNVSALPPEKLKYLYKEVSGVPPLFDRLILMVIDGLPAEFVLGKDQMFLEAMPYTQSLLSRGLAIGYHAKAAPPTVTMPRLKAMVSGAIGGFLDVATNFNTHAFLDDNLIVQFLRIGWNMVMLGDETWLKLFPQMFYRHDGVSSFFVKDTVRVDHNVSRHLAKELSQNDWDLLILHYLGLDHVGHIAGRNSAMMVPKLMEMDEVIKRIHSSFTSTREINQKTLLLIVSDHGMTENGNHGGASYEETDSLALFVGAKEFSDSPSREEINQVDIAPTLALLFGVPIPKNNVGTVVTEVFTSMQDEELLRVLELNSWQLLRLLHSHFTEMECGRSSCDSRSGKSDGAEKFCCSYLTAATLHESWKLNNSSRSVLPDEYWRIVLAYNNFLETASKWLSSRSTDKPIVLLTLGVAALCISCLAFVSILFLLDQDVNFKGSQHHSPHHNNTGGWHLDEVFAVAVIFILVISMGSSSMIEEEQYIWHFMTSSLYLVFLKRTLQSVGEGGESTSAPGQGRRSFYRIYYIVAVLISGRLLRGWHQGGVNWTYLPDISKLLEHAGIIYVKSLHLSAFFVIIICSAVVGALRLKIYLAVLLVLTYLLPVLMILVQIWRNQDGSTFTPSSTDSTTRIQIIYALLGTSTVGILVSTPWLMPVQNPKFLKDVLDSSSEVPTEGRCELSSGSFKDSIYVTGWCCIFSWGLLQMLLQQPINSAPTSLVLVQILASCCYFCECGIHVKQWVKVATLYYLGMAGHFGLGNTNTLATIDVAGAFIGTTSHSTIISGILMFCITYASPMLSLLSTMILVPTKDTRAIAESYADFGHVVKTTVAYSCLVPLGLNSILLVAYTIVLLAMRNHLFVWSVFSPKYLYVCATTVCVYIGTATVALTTTYTCAVFGTRRMMMNRGLRGRKMF